MVNNMYGSEKPKELTVVTCEANCAIAGSDKTLLSIKRHQFSSVVNHAFGTPLFSASSFGGAERPGSDCSAMVSDELIGGFIFAISRRNSARSSSSSTNAVITACVT